MEAGGRVLDHQRDRAVDAWGGDNVIVLQNQGEVILHVQQSVQKFGCCVQELALGRDLRWLRDLSEWT